MADATKIVIKQEYFDNIKVAIDTLNNFFGSNFKTKNFPMIDSNEQLDASLLSILSWMNNVDPTWIEDTEKMDDVIDKINEMAENMEGEGDLLTQLTNNNDTSTLDTINAIIGHKMLQYIADHFDVFSELMNGIYTFELFTKPSKYRKAIDTFSKPIPIDEIANALGDNQYQVFNEEKYLHGVFDNPQITLPKTMKLETEKTRFDNREDLQNVEIMVDDTVQEAAEINYFVEMRPEHLKYHSGLHVVQISKQFEAKVNKLVSDLRACNTIEDLKKYFENFPFSPDEFSHVVIPCILARVFASSRKFPNQSYDQTALNKYTDSYKSILSQNKGANRFANYDLFSTFKADKEGTIKFIEDFMKLRLVNDESGSIANNTLLTLFNIFDSRIYLDIMYNMLPSDVRTTKAPSEDAFVKKVRAKINKNSRNANVYQKEATPSDNTVQTSEQVVEYVTEAFNQASTLSTTDLQYCEHYMDLIHDEINTMGDKLYNYGVSVNELDEFIGESYGLFQEGFISKFFENRRKKKERASTEAQIKAFEDKYNVKLTEEHKSIILDDPEKYDAISKKIHISLNRDYSSNMYKMYDYSFEYLQSIFKDKAQGMYPVMFADFEYDELQYQELYSDAEGNIYSAIYNKRHKFEKVASSIKDFFETYKDKNVYWKFFEVCRDLMYVYYNEETRKDEEHHVQIEVYMDSNNAVNPKAASYISMYATSGAFSELIVDEVLPKIKEKFGDVYHIKRAVFDMDGNMELFIKYNGKETSLKTSNVWTEAFVYEAGDVDGTIPDYMKTRIKLSDGDEESPKEPVVTDVQLPPDIPSNAFDDLGNSIDARLNNDAESLDNVLGSGYDGDISKKGGDGKVVYNITYNYNNSYNQTNSNNKTETNSHNIQDTHNQTDSHNTVNDLSTGKKTISNNHQNSHNTSTSTKKNTVNSHNVNNPRKRGTNNNNNSTVLSDTKDSNAPDTSKKDTFSTGKSIQEVFAFLESEEPLSDAMSAGDPPKEDMLTKAMDNDRKTLSKQQSAKKSLQKVGNTARAAVKPIGRAKQWLTGMVNSLIKRDEDKVKAEMLENPSYRSAVFKAGRLALKLGLFATFTAINPWIGAIYAGAEGLKAADKNRLRKEVQDEFATELKIMDEKIEQCKHELNYGYGKDNPAKKKELYQLIRQRDKMQQMAPQSMRTYVKRAIDIN